MITIALLSTEVRSNILHIINPGPKEIEKKSSGKKKKKKRKKKKDFIKPPEFFFTHQGVHKSWTGYTATVNKKCV